MIDGAKRAELIAKDTKSAEIIKPLAVGADVRKWRTNYKDKWLIFTPWHFPLHEDTSITGSSLKAEKEFERIYPSIYGHLAKYKKELSLRNKAETGIRYEWYALQRCAATYFKEFDKPKIVYQAFQVKPCFAFDNNGMFINNAVWMIVIDDLYLLGILNSQSFWQEITRHCTQIQNGYQLLRVYLEKAIVPNASESEKEPIIKLVQKCLDAKGVNCEEWEKEIDERVAALYGL